MTTAGIARTSYGETVVLPKYLADVAAHVSAHGSATYGGLARALKVPQTMLYVYAQRLELAGIVWRTTKIRKGKPHTSIKLRDGVQILNDIRKIS